MQRGSAEGRTHHPLGRSPRLNQDLLRGSSEGMYSQMKDYCTTCPECQLTAVSLLLTSCPGTPQGSPLEGEEMSLGNPMPQSEAYLYTHMLYI